MDNPKRSCVIDDCGRAVVGRDMCKTHWQRWRRWGDPRHVGSRWTLTAEERFWQHVEKSDTCWAWTASTKNGYGCFWPADRMVMAHRHAYELVHGSIPGGMTLDHLCHTAMARECTEGPECPHRACVRPEHLAPVPLAENIQRGGNSAKTHCKRGHEFTAENTWAFVNASGGPGRKCRTCGREDSLAYRERQRRR